MSSKPRVYYAHSVGLYGSPQEARDMATLACLGFEVSNPNHPHLDAAYKAFGMDAFKAEIEHCGALAFRANADGSINAGVAFEIAHANAVGIPVFELPCAVARRTLTVEQTRSFLNDSGAR